MAGKCVRQTPSERLLDQKVEFKPKFCPECRQILAVKKIGVWGYYCTECLQWWGTFDPYPLVNGKEQT